MTGCSAPKCKNRSEEGYTMYRYPSEAKRQKLWVTSSKLKRKPSLNTALCSGHFDDSCFYISEKGKERLRKDAVPTIFPASKRSRPKIKVVYLNKPAPPSSLTPTEKRNKILAKQRRIDEKAEADPQVRISQLEQEVEELKTCLRNADKKLLASERRSVQCSKMLKFLNDDQRQVLLRGPENCQDMKWSTETIDKAVKLRLSCGAEGYDNLLKTGYPLPIVMTLQQKTEA